MTGAGIASARRKFLRASVRAVSIPLTLGVPHRPEPGALVAGLLHQRSRSSERVERDADEATSGPAIVSASVLRDHPGEPALGRLVVDLDIDPEELRGSRAVYEAVRFHLDVDAETIDDATALRVPSPLVLFPDLGDGPTLDAVTQIVEAHRIPGLIASASPRQVADVLAVVAHADGGFFARARSGSEVIALLSATVAALRGDDIATAWANPDTAALAALRPEAAEAVRTVLLGIEVDDATAAHHDLAAAGLVPAPSA